MHTIRCCGKTVHLIDTPGLDDTNRQDEDVFQELAYWLVKSYQMAIRIAGVVYLHRVTDPRLAGSAYRGLQIFKKMCGADNYRGIILATTRWDEVDSTVGNERVNELKERTEFWGDLLAGGSRVTDTAAGQLSALKIINHFTNKNERYTLRLQEEMVNQNVALHQTEAGQILYNSWAAEKNSLEAQTTKTLEDMREDLNGHYRKRSQDLKIEMNRLSENLSSRIDAMKSLEASSTSLVTRWDKRTAEQMSMIRQQRQETEQSLKTKENEHRHWGDCERSQQLELEIRHLRRKLMMLRRSESHRAETYSLIFGGASALTGAISAACAILPLVAPLALACVIM
jgi:hypothetical protein